jgi:DNA repair protein RadC
VTGVLKGMPAGEQPRERLFRLGAGALTDAEILAILMGSGIRGKSVLEVGRELAAGGWTSLAQKPVEGLLQFPGVGPARAAVLAAALEVGRRVRRAGALERSIRSSDDVADLLGDEMAALAQEQFRVVLLNTKLHVLTVETVFIGGLDAVTVHPREVFRRAVQAGAAGIVAVHNHPSGDPTPSREDRLLTRRLQEAGDILGVPLWDHVVLGRGGHVSFRDMGFLH